MKTKTKFIWLIIPVVLIMIILSNTYLRRYFFFNFPDVYDYKKLPTTLIKNGNDVFVFQQKANFEMQKILPIKYNNQLITNLDRFLEDNFTTAFLIIKEDTILYEDYFNGHQRDTYCKSFSISKNVISALLGIAISENKIKNVNEPITNYIPEIKDKRLNKLTIKQCLMGTSGLKFNRGGLFPWHDDARVYYSGNISNLLTKIQYHKEPGTIFKTDEFSPHLLAWILERGTGKKVQDYPQEKIWEPLGMEYPALWVLDRNEDGFVVANSGLTARPIDFAKFGRLYLYSGNWNGNQIIPNDWILESTIPDTSKNTITTWGNLYYKYMWWGKIKDRYNFDFEARGHFSQRIYVSPSKNVIVLRFGTKQGEVNWSDFISDLIDKF